MLKFNDFFSGQYDIKKSSLLSVTCSNQYEVLAFALLDPSYLIVASGSPDVKVNHKEKFPSHLMLAALVYAAYLCLLLSVKH